MAVPRINLTATHRSCADRQLTANRNVNRKKKRKIIIDFPIDSVKDQPCTNYKKENYTGDITDDNILERKNEIKNFRRG